MNGGKSDAVVAVARPAMRRWWSWILGIAVLTAILALVFETKRLAELAGANEVAARGLRRERDKALAAVPRLEAEVAASAARLQAMSDTLQQRTDDFERAAAESTEAALRTLQPMSEGVRVCLQTLHECLRVEGFASLRFLSARRLDQEGLHEVEALDVHSDGLGVAFLYAARMTAQLDRGRGELVLRFFEGHRMVGGERVGLPEDGWSIVFAPVDGRLFEERLPYLVRADGVYSEPKRPGRPASDVDPEVRGQWLERFDRLLAAAGTQQNLQVARFRGMRDACFLEADIVGTDNRHHVISGAHCARLCVEVDIAAGVVSLLLSDGVLRQGAAQSTITAEGYRMLLPNITPSQATDIMLGMVVNK